MTLHQTETTQDYAHGHQTNTNPRSVFDTVADVGLYRNRWQQRCLHYQTLRAYYRGTFYENYPQLVKSLKLYSGIRQIFGPLRRAVRIDVAKVPGAWKLPDDAPDNLIEAIKEIRRSSNATATYSRAVLHGAVAGEFGLMVCDDWRARSVRIVALRPDEVITGTLADGSPFGLIIKTGLVDRGGVYEYAQLITNNTITTFRNGLQHDYDGGGAKRPNALGFVPVLLTPYLAGEDGIGENAFTGTQELLDRVNDAASQGLDVLQRNAEPYLVLSGTDNVEIDPDNNTIVLSEADAKAYTVAPNLVIKEALELITTVLAEFKHNLPQLIFDDLRSRNDLAYDTVLTLCTELVDHIRDVRTHVDAAIVQAEQWAIMAAQLMQIPTFAGIDPADHRLDDDRPVIQPTPSQAIDLEGKKITLEKNKRELENPQPAAPGAAPAQQQKKPGLKTERAE